MNVTHTYAIAGSSAIIYKYDYSNRNIFKESGEYQDGVTEVGILIGQIRYKLEDIENKLSQNNCVFALLNTGIAANTTYNISLYYIKNSQTISVNSTVITTKKKGTCTFTYPGEDFTTKHFIVEAGEIWNTMVASDIKVTVVLGGQGGGAAAAFSGGATSGTLYVGNIDRSIIVHELAHSVFLGKFDNGVISNSKITKLCEFIYDIPGAYAFCFISHSYPFNSSERYSFIEDCLIMAVVNIVING